MSIEVKHTPTTPNYNMRTHINIQTILLALIALTTLPCRADNDSIPPLRAADIIIDTPEDVPDPNVPEEVEVPELKEWKDYIAQPFSAMKDKKLKQISTQLATLPDTRAVQNFKKSFEKTMALRQEYEQCWNAARKPYEFDAVEDAKEKAYNLESKVNPTQAADIHSGLLTVLVRFRKGAITMKQIVESFEKILETVPKDAKGKYVRGADTKKKLTAQFEEVLTQHKESLQLRIKGNPYLESLYSAYVGGMRMNPFNTGLQGVRDQIMSQDTRLPE